MTNIESPRSLNDFMLSNPEMDYSDYCSELRAYRQGIALAIEVTLDDLHTMSTDEIRHRLTVVSTETAA